MQYQSEASRKCAVLAALQARNTSHQLRRAGYSDAADKAWKLVQIHLSRSAKMYKIIDRKTGQQVGALYSFRTRARSRADKLDNEYGAYRYSVVPA